MLKIALILSLNVVLITASVTTLYGTPETYIEWKINNFFDLPTKINYCLNSTAFLLANKEWGFQICPNGQTVHPSRGYVNLYLIRVDSGGAYRVNFTMGFKDHNGSEFNSMQNEMIFNDKKWNTGWLRFIKRSNLLCSKDTFVPEDTLTIFCKVHILNKIKDLPQITPSSELDCPHYISVCYESEPLINEYLPLSRTTCNTTQGTETLSDNLKDMYTGKRFSDVRIIVNNTEFAAHKVILSYRVPAFDSILEKTPDKIEITDSDPESFEEFLRFIYTGKLEKMTPKKAMSLYLTADKFNMYELKEGCARYIAEHDLNIESFYDIRHLANLHSDSILLMATTEFFISNAKLILSSEKWEQFHTDDPLQVNKLFLAYVEKKN